MKKYNYLALGDSYTIGEDIDSEDSFPNHLIKSAKEQSFIVEKFSIIATTGWTTTDLINALMQSNCNAIQWDVITLLIGVNNQYQNKDIDLYKQEYQILLRECLKLVNQNPNRILGVSIPDYSVTPFAQQFNTQKISKEINEYNRIANHFLTAAGCKNVNITGLSRLSENDESLLTNDNLHPSGKQYKLWSERIFPELTFTMQNYP